jgi:adenylate cyclase
MMSSQRVERRLAAIVVADIVGYSRLIAADEEATLKEVRSIRAGVIDPALAQYRGRVVGTRGDGILAEFSSVVDAVRCASEIQDQMADRNAALSPATRIEFRIGINVGEVVVEDGDIVGDGVNVAARLEAIAKPGGICVSARVQEDSAGKVNLHFEDIGHPELKNIARPVKVYRLYRAPFPTGRRVLLSRRRSETSRLSPSWPSPI